MLCTPNKTFHIHQVQTSNCLFITQPAFDAHGNDIPTPTTCAIASCTDTLELHPTDASAVTYLEQALPVYDIVNGDVEVPETRTDKAGVFADIPLSNAQCEHGWREVMAFEAAGTSYRPSVNTLRQVWSSINAAAMAESVTLDSQFLAYDLAEVVAEESYPVSLTLAVFSHLISPEQDSAGQWSCLDRRKTVAFVGRNLLQSRRGPSAYLLDDFLEEWRDALPEAWRSDADLDAIEGAYEAPSATTIRAKTTVTASTTKAAVKGKWHERFAKGRQK